MPSVRTFTVLLGASLLGLACGGRAQCQLTWLPADPAPALTGDAESLGLWDPDGAGPLTTRLLVGAGGFPGLSGGTGVDMPLVAFDGSDWTGVPVPAGASYVTAIGNVLGQTAVATLHVAEPPGAPGFLYCKVSILTPGGYTVIADHVRGWISAIAEYGGEIVFTGRFTGRGYPYETQSLANIARVTSSGAIVGFGAGITGPLGTGGLTLANFNGRLYVGGIFIAVDGVAATNLASWNGTSWAPAGDPNGIVRQLAVRNAISTTSTHLFAAGDFTAIGPLPRIGVARFTVSTNAWAAMDVPSTCCWSLSVRSVGQTGYEATAILSDGSAARWNGTGWTSLDPAGPNRVFKAGLLQWGSRLVSRQIGAIGTLRLRAFDGTTWPPLVGRGIDGAVRAALALDSDYVIGGSFAAISGVAMNGIARGGPGAWQPLGAGFGGGAVLALARLGNGDLIAGGDFTTAGGQPAAGLARWDGTAWLAFGGAGVIRSLTVLANGDLLAGGTFASIGGVAAANVARWNGSQWSAFGTGVAKSGGTAAVHCARQLANGELVVGGDFTSAGSTATKNVARWNGSSWSGYGMGMVSTVTGLDQRPSGEILAWRRPPGFPSCQTCNADVWNGVLWSAVNTGGVSSGATTVAATLLPNGGAAVASTLDDTGPSTLASIGQVAYRAAAPDGSVGGWTNYPLSAAAVHGSVVARNGDILVFGAIDAIGQSGATADTGSSGFVVLRPTCPATAVAVGAGCAGSAGPLSLAATSLPWLGGTFRATATGFAPGALAIEVVGLQSINLPLISVLPTAAPGCTLLASLDATNLLLPSGGSVAVALAVPPAPSLVGMTVYDQVAQLEFTAGGVLGTISITNALAMTLGSY